METLINNTSIDAIEAQYRNSQGKHDDSQKKFNFDPKLYLNTQLDKNVNEKTLRIRILPVSGTDPNIFMVLRIHSLKVPSEIAKSGFKSFVCLNDSHIEEKDPNGCPLCKKANELFELANLRRSEGKEEESKTIFKQACTFKAKNTYIVRVIDRDNEIEGPKFWRFNENSKGEGIYDKLMNIFSTRKEPRPDGTMYNIFDLNDGKDLVLNIKRTFTKDGKSTDKVSINIVDATFPSPLSKDVEQANKWINDGKKWTDAYSIRHSDYLSIVAEGKIPVKNKETGKYEGRDTAVSVKQQQDEEANKVAQQILNAPQATPQSDVHIVAPVSNVVNQSQMVQPTVTTDATVDDDSDPLPF